jgi:ParB family chromosome partitioning protein
MTDSITTDAGQPATGTIEHIDPHTLIVDTNVRDDAYVDAQFVASIKEHGVLVPIAGVRADDGNVRVRAGQRRTLAAREAGLATVPVYVRAATGGDENAQLVERVAEQIVENDHRSDLTDAQRARGIQQMIDAGLSVTRVAKRLAVAKDTIKAAETAAKSTAAMDALADGQLSLVEAAAITEFEDMPGALDRLLNDAGTRRFEHTVAQLREQRASAEAEAQAAQGYSERGFTILSQRPQAMSEDYIPLRYLLTADGAEADEQAVTEPAHWAVLLYEDTALCDVDCGELVDEDDVDWDTEDDAEATPAEGKRHAASVTEATVFAPEYFCIDYRAAALKPADWFARRAGMVEIDGDATVDLDDEAREAARAQALAERAEAEKRERKKVLALNKLGAAAITVRRDFVRKLLTRKTPPKGAAIFVAASLARDSYLLTGHDALDTTAELLGLDSTAAVAKAAGELSANGDGRAQVITLALVLGAAEARTPKDAWRNATTSHWSNAVSSADYLRWLADNGYPLATVEEIVTGAKDAEGVYSQYLDDASTD